ncbi:hypothetical protein J27TS7_55580 [Paenibacillus dendritiformis]|nr:hypothetical protein J27TS7_55580 [Paenibacillus dendritiformis]
MLIAPRAFWERGVFWICEGAFSSRDSLFILTVTIPEIHVTGMRSASFEPTRRTDAEHIMLGNDLGRIAAYGSVRADELMVIKTYYYVMHLVSEVPETHAEGKDAFDVIRAAVPGGTITGAPKVRTMEIIEELEPVRRRPPYTGSFGWIDYNGDLELNINIRTLVMKDQIGSIQAGAGIVTIPNRNGNMPNV